MKVEQIEGSIFEATIPDPYSAIGESYYVVFLWTDTDEAEILYTSLYIGGVGQKVEDKKLNRKLKRKLNRYIEQQAQVA